MHRKQPSGNSNLLNKITDKSFPRKSKFEREIISDQSVYMLHNAYFYLVLTQINLLSFNSILTRRKPNNIRKLLSFMSRSFMCVCVCVCVCFNLHTFTCLILYLSCILLLSILLLLLVLHTLTFTLSFYFAYLFQCFFYDFPSVIHWRKYVGRFILNDKRVTQPLKYGYIEWQNAHSPQRSINCCLIGNLQKNLSFCKLSLCHNLENVK